MKTLILSIKIILIFCLLVALGTGVYIYSGAKDIAADTEHHPVEHWVLRTVRRHSMARGVERVENRMPATLTEAQLHANVIAYEAMCASCHKPPGRADSALARGLNPSPPDMTRAAGRYPPEKLFWVTKHGVRMTGMPAWGLTHTDAELWELVAFIKRFPDMRHDDYEVLLASARAAGVEHTHDHHHDHGSSTATPFSGAHMVMHKTPWCGCCTIWAEQAEAAGFHVEVREHEDLDPIRLALGVPSRLGACHTAEVEGYFVEGHVPFDEIKRMLAERPNARGLAVPGMPLGSPGMEQGNRYQAYDVLLVDPQGTPTVYQHYPARRP